MNQHQKFPEILQKNGNNVRQITVAKDHLVIDTQIAGKKSHEVIPLDAKFLKHDRVTDIKLLESQVSKDKTMIGYSAIVLLFFISIPVFGGMASRLGNILGGVSLMLLFVALIAWTIKIRPHKINFIIAYYGSMYFLFYNRNEYDRVDVSKFIKELEATVGDYIKQTTLHFNAATSTEEKRGRLSWLYDAGLLSDAELDKHLKQLKE
jgi:hypothetical protein